MILAANYFHIDHQSMATDVKDNKLHEQNCDELADSLNDLFISILAMVKSELHGTSNQLELLEKMNARVEKEYRGFGDLSSDLRVFMERLKSKSTGFDEYVEEIDAIEKQVTEFEAVVSMLDQYITLFESKLQSAYKNPSS